MKITGRLAPSPTGAQHLGNARTYLIAWLAARSRHGRIVLRIEDIDSPRVKRGASEQVCDDLRWLGIDWDEGPVYQTTRLAAYEKALSKLKAQELVYPCTCTRLDVERAASAPHEEHEGPVYPGTCAARRVGDAAEPNGSFCWRFRVSDDHAAFDDGFRGRVQVNLREVGGDFVVWKSAGMPAYQLAVVADDAEWQITEVVRGDDLVTSTPRQLLIYQSLGMSPPQYFHVPLVVGPDGRRLAKRHGDTRLATLREAGVPPEAVIGLLAWSCGWISQIEPISVRELLPFFNWETIPSMAFALTPELLRRIGFNQ